MQKILINLQDSRLAFNEFNHTLLNNSLNEYLFNEAKKSIYKEDILLIISNINDLEKQKEIRALIINFYQNKVKEFKKIDKFDNYFHLILLLLGVLLIIISEQFTLFLSELFLIAGWVVIWEMTYDILFTSIRRKKHLNIYKKLAKCTINFTNNL